MGIVDKRDRGSVLYERFTWNICESKKYREEKRMKKKLMVCMVAIMTAGIVLIGCGKNDAADTVQEEAVQEEAVQEEALQEETVQEETTVPEEAEGSGEDEISEEELADLYHAFGESLQAVIGKRSMEDMAELLGYPCYVGIDDGVVVENKEQFLALDADKVFTDELVNAVENADLDAIEVSAAGFVVGDPSGKPNVTIGLDSNGTIGVTGINY